MTDAPFYNPKERELVHVVEQELGDGAIVGAIDRGARVLWKGDEPVLELGHAGQSMALGDDHPELELGVHVQLSVGLDGRLHVRLEHAGVVYLGYRENGRTHWIGDVPKVPAWLN